MKESQIEKMLVRHKLNKDDAGFKRLPLDYETNAIRCVREGNVKGITHLNYADFKDKMGATASTPKRTFEYNTVAAITLFTRAAIEGGAKPDDAYNLSEVLIQALEKAGTVQEIQEIFRLSERMFAKMVHRARAKNKPYQIEKCRAFIGENIFRKISVAEVAESVGLHPHYLSTLFCEHEGITLRDYIQREKINAACHMLRYSNRHVSEIALRLGYKSQSKFTEIFRKWQAMTPTEYRNLHHHPAAGSDDAVSDNQ